MKKTHSWHRGPRHDGSAGIDRQHVVGDQRASRGTEGGRQRRLAGALVREKPDSRAVHADGTAVQTTPAPSVVSQQYDVTALATTLRDLLRADIETTIRQLLAEGPRVVRDAEPSIAEPPPAAPQPPVLVPAAAPAATTARKRSKVTKIAAPLAKKKAKRAAAVSASPVAAPALDDASWSEGEWTSDDSSAQ